MRLALLLAGALAILCFGCGGSGGTSAGAASISVTPEFAFVAQSESVNLTAQASGLGASHIVWSASGGSIVATGPNTATYTAPSQTGAFQITARSQDDPSIQATTTVEVATPGVAIHVGSSTMVAGASQDITASVIGNDDQRVTWTVSAGSFTEIFPGSIRFTAPDQAGDVTVTAQSVADPSKTSSVTIEVVERVSVVTGRVRAKRSSRIGVGNVEVVFFDNSGVEVGRATTSSDGTFVDELPMSATRFHLVPGSINGSYYHEYTYGSLIYDADEASCKASLPDIRGQLEVRLPNEVVLTERTNPPPVPTGCS